MFLISSPVQAVIFPYPLANVDYLSNEQVI
jgi:hypothetical protein